MSQLYYYNYAYIDLETRMCYEVLSTTSPHDPAPDCVELPVNDFEYIGKYYIDGNWYEDAEGTIPWTSSLL